MAKSKCSKCDGETFEMAEVTPVNSDTKATFIQCTHCGTVAGVLDIYNVGQYIKQIAVKLDVKI